MTLRIGSLCTGYGGLDLALHQVLGDTTLQWVSEVDPNACKVIEARYPDAPNLGDLTKHEWVKTDPIDVLTAGYPCQPFSHAGQRKGTDDERHLWPHISNAIGVLRPRIVVLENVAGHLSLGGASVVGSLAALGYDARWVVVRASDVGACHRRARLFIVGTDTNGDGRSLVERVEPRLGPRHDAHGLRPLLPTPVANDDHKTAAEHLRKKVASGAGETNTSLDVMARQAAATGQWANKLLPTPTQGDGEGGGVRSGLTWDRTTQSTGDGGASRLRDVVGLLPTPTTQDAANTAGPSQHNRHTPPLNTVVAAASWGDYADAIDRHEVAVGRPAPPPTDDKGRLSPPFVEWMMMLPAGWVTDVLTSRTAALKALGNGVVPPQAAHALRILCSMEVAA